MASITITETEVATQVNIYRNMNGTPAGGTKVTISGGSMTDHPDFPNGRVVFDEDVTALLTPQQLQQFDTILDIAEQYLKNKWNIP